MLSPLPQSFVTIVETGSITRAADELNIAKSAVSQNLKKLEQQLGVRLAVRTTRRFSLTPAGERYYRRCQDILALSQQAATEMEAFGASPSGPITITAPHALVAPIIAPAMAEVVQRLPKLKPLVIAEDKRLDLIAERIDVSITVGEMPDSSLRARKIGDLRDILCIAPASMVGTPDSDHPAFAEWVQKLPYIAHVREPSIVEHSVPTQDGSAPVRLRFHPSFRCNTIEAMAACAREGLGMALLPDIGVSKDLREGHLVRVCGSLSPKPTPIYAVHAYGTLAPRSVRETINAIHGALTTAAP